MSILLPEDERPDLVIVIQDDQTRGTCESLLQKLRPLHPDRVYVDAGGYGRALIAYLTDDLGPNVVRELPKVPTMQREERTLDPWHHRAISPECLKWWPARELEALIERAINALMGPKAPPRVMNDDGLKLLKLDPYVADLPNWLPAEKTMQGIGPKDERLSGVRLGNAQGGAVGPTGGYERLTRQARAAEVNRVIDETIKAQQTQPKAVHYTGTPVVDLLQADKDGRELAKKLLEGHRMLSDDLGDEVDTSAARDAKPEPTFMEKVQAEREQLQLQQRRLALTQEERHSFEAMKREVQWMRSRRGYTPGFVDSGPQGDDTPLHLLPEVEGCNCQGCTKKRERRTEMQLHASNAANQAQGASWWHQHQQPRRDGFKSNDEGK